MDSIVILRDVAGRPATKVHTRTAAGEWETTPYGHASEFRWASRPLANFEDLATILGKLANRPLAFVVRGAVAADAPDIIRRTYKADGSWLIDADRRWLCVDIDGAPAGAGCHITQALGLLPAWLGQADCVWQYSSSHGVKAPDKIRLHLWFWLTRPLCNPSLRRWARGLEYVDAALYQPVQPHYVAGPLFVGGAEDPWPGPRMGIRRGNGDAAPPPDLLNSGDMAEIEAQEAAQREQDALLAAARARRASAGLAHPQEAHEALWAGRIDADLDELGRTPEGDRHDAIWRIAQRIASLAHAVDAAAGARPRIEAVAVALLAGEGRQDEARRRVAEGWEAGLANPRQGVWRPR